MRVLVVDGSRTVRDRVVATLSDLTNFVVQAEAEDLVGGLRLLEEQPPDVLVMDVALPDGDGTRLIEAARRHPARPAVVVFTSADSPELRARCVDAGADLYLGRGTSPDELMDGVCSVALKRKALRGGGGGGGGGGGDGDGEAGGGGAMARALLDLLPHAAWITNLEGTAVEHVNGAASRLLGPVLAAALRERPDAWLDAVHPEDRARASCGAATRRARGVGHQYRLLGAGETPRAVREEAIVVGGAGDGRVIVALAEDDSHGAAALGRRFEVLGRIAAAVAHDLSNYLAVVDISLALLSTRIQDASARMEVLRLRGAMESATTLTQNLVDYARGSAPESGLVDLGTVVRRTLEVFRRVIASDVQVEVDVQSDLPPVQGVAAELEQLLVNLVLNARDAMPRGGLLRVAVRAENDQAVMLEVADTGDGIAEAARIARGLTSPSGRARAHGTGIGLGVVRSVVERHGAALRIGPRTGGGTRVVVTFLVVGARA